MALSCAVLIENFGHKISSKTVYSHIVNSSIYCDHWLRKAFVSIGKLSHALNNLSNAFIEHSEQ